MTEKELLDILKKYKVLEIKGGRAILHFDKSGNLRKIEINKIVFIV